MEKKEIITSGAGEIQVVELTMDDTEDQDELNRRLRKLGERDNSLPVKNGRTEQGESATESSGK